MRLARVYSNRHFFVRTLAYRGAARRSTYRYTGSFVESAPADLAIVRWRTDVLPEWLNDGTMLRASNARNRPRREMFYRRNR